MCTASPHACRQMMCVRVHPARRRLRFLPRQRILAAVLTAFSGVAQARIACVVL